MRSEKEEAVTAPVRWIKSEQRGLQKVGAALVIVTITYLLCERPNFHPESWVGWRYHWWLDMMIHGGYYYCATFLLYPLFCKEKKTVPFLLCVLLLSYLFEVLQAWVPGRSLTGLDFLSNTLGVVGAVCVRKLRMN